LLCCEKRRRYARDLNAPDMKPYLAFFHIINIRADVKTNR
jgi:hypothetical protein